MTTQQMVQLYDKKFKILVPYNDLEQAIDSIALRINTDYKDKPCPLFLGVLNGGFMFMAELMKRIEFPCETSFVKIASYEGTSSTGNINELIGLTDNLKGRHVIIVEDIIDTGNSIEYMLQLIKGHSPESITVATLLLKPDVYSKKHHIKYVAKEVPNKFIIGFGMDYNNLGRNLKHLYEVVDE